MAAPNTLHFSNKAGTRAHPLASASYVSVTGTPDVAYGATEQTILNALKAIANQLIPDLRDLGLIGGSTPPASPLQIVARSGPGPHPPTSASYIAITDTADGTYGTEEQTMINELAALFNQLLTDLTAMGFLKGTDSPANPVHLITQAGQGPHPLTSPNHVAVSGTAGATYTSTEENMIADLQTLVNQLVVDLKDMALITA